MSSPRYSFCTCQITVRDALAFSQVVHDFFDAIDRNRKAGPFHVRPNGRVHGYDMARFHVHQGPTAVTRVDAGVRLNEIDFLHG